MKQSAMIMTSQWKLPLVDIPALALPEQIELAHALMELLIEVARQIPPTPRDPAETAVNGDLCGKADEGIGTGGALWTQN
jgi:hypothetical protein